MFFFQIPRLPELLLRRDDFALLRRSLTTESRSLTPEDLAAYVEAWSQPGALRAAVSYYRAMFRPDAVRRMPKPVPVTRPTLVIWGENDSFLGTELARPDPKWVPDARVAVVASARHFVHHDQPEEVNRLIVAFLAG
jgi:pimeloyl-ACP methyl ester carboxylesterase